MIKHIKSIHVTGRIFTIITIILFSHFMLHASEMDRKIESSIKKTYVYTTYLVTDTITAVSEDGVVTLTGTVSDTSHKYLAQDTVEGLPGVKRVENKLTIAKQDKSENIDSWLGVRVKTALLFHRNVRTARTDVSVKDGVVTLTGIAATQAQKELISEYTADIEDVKGVKNDMTVSPAPVTPADPQTSPDMNISKADITPMPVKSSGQPHVDAPDKNKLTSIFMNSDGESIDDASITAQIKSSLRINQKTNTLRPNVGTQKGIVTLSGKVNDDMQKELVSKLVNDIYGVVNVINNMKVNSF